MTRVGIDTNVLFRWLFHDPANPAQSEAATRAVAGAEGPIHISVVVLAELAWLMRSKIGLDRDTQAHVLGALLGRPEIEIAQRGEVEAAATAFAAGGPGFADHLLSALNRAARCRTTLTFDKAAARAEGFTLID